jgi:hypothetical protein
MATGFVQRYKGKITCAEFWLAGTQINASGTDLNVNLGWGTVGGPSTAGSTAGSSNPGVTLGSSRTAGIDIFAPPSSGLVIALAPPVAGVNKVIKYSTANSSTGLKIKTGNVGITITGGESTAYAASTFTNVILSTSSMTIEFFGLSTTEWLFGGLYPTTSVITYSSSTF